MEELWDIYDTNRKKTGRYAKRDIYQFKKGEYHIVVSGIILNSQKQILLSQRAAHKKFGLMWEFNGGSIIAGETSLEGVIRELKEELGIELSKKEAIYFKETRRERKPPNFKDIWVFKKDIDIKEITFPDKETIDAKWVTQEEFEEMLNNKEITPNIEFDIKEFKQVLKLKQRQSYNYIGKQVEVIIDRPLGSSHSKKYPEHIYPINYGYIPNTISGDKEELDAYILGIDKPLKKFIGECIAVIHRINDDDDKLIVVSKGKKYSDEEIRNSTNFQEQYFESEIIR